MLKKSVLGNKLKHKIEKAACPVRSLLRPSIMFFLRLGPVQVAVVSLDLQQEGLLDSTHV